MSIVVLFSWSHSITIEGLAPWMSTAELFALGGKVVPTELGGKGEPSPGTFSEIDPRLPSRHANPSLKLQLPGLSDELCTSAMVSAPSGCWTCKLRHRKCDLRTPACRECSARSITCHGYGPKPQWMDGAAAERLELRRIKKAVKQHTQRLREARNQRTARDGASNTAGGTTSPGLASPEVQVGYPIETSPRPPSTATTHLPSLSLLDADAPGEAAPHSFERHSATLLMHYIDHVFFWQFPYFRPRSRLGDRGWLLFFLSNRGPLYHAALALSALHRQATEDFRRPRNIRDQQVIGYHSRALRMLCDFSRITEGEKLVTDTSKLTEFVASSLMLISFEVRAGSIHPPIPIRPIIRPLASILLTKEQ